MLYDEMMNEMRSIVNKTGSFSNILLDALYKHKCLYMLSLVNNNKGKNVY